VVFIPVIFLYLYIYFIYIYFIFIPVTRRVKGYTRFVGKYVTGRRKRFRPHQVYIFLIRITSRVDLAMSVCPSVRKLPSCLTQQAGSLWKRFGCRIILSKIEDCLNSRPLSPKSDDPTDLLALTPGHFLIGGPLLSIVEPEVKVESKSIINRCQHLKALHHQFRA